MTRLPNKASPVRAGASVQTAQAAADFVSPSVRGMSAVILTSYRQDGPASPEQMKQRLDARTGRDWLLTTVRSRVSQMKIAGLLVDTGERVPGCSGKVRVAVWRAATEAEMAQRQPAQVAA